MFPEGNGAAAAGERDSHPLGIALERHTEGALFVT
jgi:hypothetical protein